MVLTVLGDFLVLVSAEWRHSDFVCCSCWSQACTATLGAPYMLEFTQVDWTLQQPINSGIDRRHSDWTDPVEGGQAILTGALCSGGLEDTDAVYSSFKHRFTDTHTNFMMFFACQVAGRRRSSSGFQETRVSRFRSCLLESEQSASSLSQSEGIQSAPAAEYKVGCRRVSSHSTDTVDSSALFMGTTGADEMASRWGLDFNSPKVYWGWQTCDTFNNCLVSAKNTQRKRNDWKR